MDVGRAITEARRRAGLTQAQLAERAATSQATISAYEAGRKQPAADTFARIVAAAGSRLTVVPDAAPVVTPSAAESERRGRVLDRVLELAEAFPVRHSAELRYPRLADHVHGGRPVA